VTVGLFELLIIGFIIGSIGLGIHGLVDGLRHSDAEWKAIGQDRTLWLLAIWFFGIVGAVAYLVAIRPKFQQLPAMAESPRMPMIGAAPPGWYPDPSGAPAMRWFDGHQWTPSTAPMNSPPPTSWPMGHPQAPAPGYPPSAPGDPPPPVS